MRVRPRHLALLLTGLALAGCSEVEEASSGGYEPSQLKEVNGSDVQQVTFTKEGAERTGLRTAAVQRDGGRRVVPYESLIYDAAGRSWVYTIPQPLTFLRAEVQVHRVEGENVLLEDGPPVGTGVVTVGVTEVYGAELEIAGGH